MTRNKKLFICVLSVSINIPLGRWIVSSFLLLPGIKVRFHLYMIITACIFQESSSRNQRAVLFSIPALCDFIIAPPQCVTTRINAGNLPRFPGEPFPTFMIQMFIFHSTSAKLFGPMRLVIVSGLATR